MPKKSARKSARNPDRTSRRKTTGRTAKKGARTPTKRAAEAWFGIIIDGRRIPYTLPSVEDAEATALGLRERGHSVAIYDQETDKVVKQL